MSPTRRDRQFVFQIGPSWIVVAVIGVIAVASLALNLYLLFTWQKTVGQAGPVLRSAAELGQSIHQVASEPYRFDIPISQTVPIRMAVPLHRTIDVGIEKVAVVSHTLNIHLELPVVGVISESYPLRVELPIQVRLPVTLSTTVPISLNMPIMMTVPLTIDLQKLPFGRQLIHLGEAMEALGK